ncbi:hypothetical protein [Pseudoalteromonas rubra]|uniref:hypothetical protein n=1 Tax=Pseudoalteromonas rubra TaxID=43658 RepID=UPI002DB98AD6|nr:hypothetical protein [Pseudoalteromonas rubra]MEC4090395.1 hypothetical protein [Pseudoalteromonas rubra]
MNATQKLSKAQLYSAIYDYFAAGMFALPILTAWYLAGPLQEAHTLFGATGDYPQFSGFHLLFANLFGGFAIMWSTLRIVKREPIFGMCDGYLRLYYGSLMCLYVFAFDTSRILYLFILIEFFWSSVQLTLYYKAKKEQTKGFAAAAAA